MSLVNAGWWGGFISGVAATIVGVLLTMGWDYIKYRRETGARDAAVLSALHNDLVDNASVAQQDQIERQTETKDLVDVVLRFIAHGTRRLNSDDLHPGGEPSRIATSPRPPSSTSAGAVGSRSTSQP